MSTRAQQLKLFLAQAYGLASARLKKIEQGAANENYYIKSKNLSYICKLYPARTVSQIQFELKILTKLAKHKFLSPRVVATSARAAYAVFSGMPCIILQYIPGQAARSLSVPELATVGGQLGKLHHLLRNIKADTRRVRWDLPDIKKMARTERAQILKKKFPASGPNLDFLARELAAIRLPGNLPQGATHQDVKPDNIIRGANGRLYFIDFDNAYRGVWLFDLMTTAIWTSFKQRQLHQPSFRALLRGYERVRPLTGQEKKYLLPALRFRLLREMLVWMALYKREIAWPHVDYFFKLYKNLLATI